jgi:hypothetical protein
MDDKSETLKGKTMPVPYHSAGTSILEPGLGHERSLEAICTEINRQLLTDHVRCNAAYALRLQAHLRDPRSPCREVLARDYYKLAIIESSRGIDDDGDFDHEGKFLPYLKGVLFDLFEIERVENFHPEQISQVLKDEQRSLFCFLDAQDLSETDIQFLRGFTQELHRVLLLCPSGGTRFRPTPGLRMLTGNRAGQSIELNPDVTTIGRSPDSHLIVEEKMVSRRHAEIRKAGERFALVDLHSRNFTFLNGRRLDPDEPPPILAANDKIRICDVEFAFVSDLSREGRSRDGDPTIGAMKPGSDPYGSSIEILEISSAQDH